MGYWTQYKLSNNSRIRHSLKKQTKTITLPSSDCWESAQDKRFHQSVRPNIPPVHVSSTGSSKSHTARRDIQAFCQKVNKHPLKAFDLQTKINKGKLKWKPNLKLLMKRLWSRWAINQRPLDVFSAGQACSEWCAASCFNMQANQEKQNKNIKYFKIYFCALLITYSVHTMA